MSINQFILDGNLTRDPELRYTPGAGTPVASYTIAVDQVFYVGDEKREDTSYVPITTYGRQAENDFKFLKKGVGVTVMGRIKSWYKPDVKKGGFNFDAQSVTYRGKPSKTPDSVAQAPDDEWLREFNAHTPDSATSKQPMKG